MTFNMTNEETVHTTDDGNLTISTDGKMIRVYIGSVHGGADVVLDYHEALELSIVLSNIAHILHNNTTVIGQA